MYGWWFDECPNPKRSLEIMRGGLVCRWRERITYELNIAAEAVKHIIQATFEARSTYEGWEVTLGVRGSLSLLQNAAVIAVQGFDREWTQEFPITLDAVWITVS